MTYSKAIAQVVATILAGLLPFLVDNSLSAVEIINLGIIGSSAITIAIVPNLTAGIAKYAKGALAVVSAVLVLLTSLIADGTLTTEETLQLVIAGLGAIGVVGLPAPQFSPAPIRDGAYTVTDLD